ncbi:alpha/beta hydrolase [Candidatus Dependentiae bacterium]
MNSKCMHKIKWVLLAAVLLYKFADFCSPQAKSYGYIVSRRAGITEGAQVEKVALYSKKSDSSDQKIIRNGVLLKRDGAKGTILFCHGFTCDKDDIGFLRYMFKDYNCMTFDFRAHGENAEGQCCTLGKNEAYDVIAAARFLRAHPDLQGVPLLVYAFSMGAVASIEAQAKDNSLFDGMVLDCPFDSAENVIKQGLDNKKISIFGYEFHVPCRQILKKYVFHPYIQSFVKTLLKTFSKFGSDNIKTFICHIQPSESIKKISVPCFFIHCKNDEKISIESIKTVYYNAGSKYKKLWITNGRKHFDSFFYNPEKYEERVVKFVGKVVSGAMDKKYKHKIVEEMSDRPALNTALEVGEVKTINKEGGYEKQK